LIYNESRGVSPSGGKMMHKAVPAYMAILKLEIEDLEEDLKMLVSEVEEKHNKQQISNYVYLENLAVIKRELFGVNGIARHFDTVDSSQCEDLDQLIADLKKELMSQRAIELLPEGVIRLVERKMEKVKNYVQC